ncbi:MAG: FAD-dependent oxidoreductase [Lysobacterales bacterium]|nr:MAG: FAD-dependent oxidoreductase [Xanthomonadales bacterium]
MARKDLDRRICIIGAGAAGLSAAHFLRKRGYSRVQVLEASDRVGGKCCSTGLGETVVEAGALGATGSYREVLGLARETGVGVVEPPDQFVFDARTREFQRLNTAFRKSLSAASVRALARYFLAALRHRSLRRPGFAGVPAQLARPFSEWAAQRGMAALAPLLELPVTGFGYGSLDATPAAYVLKYIHTANFLTLLRLALSRSASYRIAGGYEGLWRAVAGALDVRLGSRVIGVQRDSSIRLTTAGEQLECDALLLAAPLDQALSYLDASDVERELFSQVRYTAYHVMLCRTRGLPNASISMHPLPGPGATCLLARGWASAEATVAYAYGVAGESPPVEVTLQLEQAIRNLGGSLLAVEKHIAWRYFPHVGPELMAAGYFDRLEALQGARNTFFAGSLLSFETVEDVVAYSKRLVERFF